MLPNYPQGPFTAVNPQDRYVGVPSDPFPLGYYPVTDGVGGYTLQPVPTSGASLAAPAFVLGTANVLGASGSAPPVNSTIAIFDVTVPVTQALGDAAATGAAAFAARRDHKHGMPALSTATPLIESGTGAVGTGVLSSREDHVHPLKGSTLVASAINRMTASVTANDTAWHDVDNASLDMTIAATTGDVIAYSLSAAIGGEAVNMGLDVATIVAGAPVNYLGGGGGVASYGFQAWLSADTLINPHGIGGVCDYVVQAGDISGGNVTLRLRYRTGTAANKTITGSANQPLQVSVKNFGH